MNYSGYLFMATSACLAAIFGPFSRYCFAEGVTPIELSFWRLIIAGLLFAMQARIEKLPRPSRRNTGIFAAFGIFSIALLSTGYLYSINIAGVSMTVVLTYTAPVWVALFSRILFKEPLPPLKLLALGLALCGAVLVCLSGGALPDSVSPAGMALALCCGLVLACQFVALSHMLKTTSATVIFSIAMPAGALAIAPFVPFSMHTPKVWLCILFIAFACSYLNFMAYAAGIKRLSPTTASIIANLELILASLVAWIWWGEFFPLQGWLGAALVLTAVFIIVLSGRKTPAPPSETS